MISGQVNLSAESIGFQWFTQDNTGIWELGELGQFFHSSLLHTFFFVSSMCFDILSPPYVNTIFYLKLKTEQNPRLQILNEKSLMSVGILLDFFLYFSVCMK